MEDGGKKMEDGEGRMEKGGRWPRRFGMTDAFATDGSLFRNSVPAEAMKGMMKKRPGAVAHGLSVRGSEMR